MECCKIFSFFAALLLFMGSMISWIIYTFLSNKLGESYSSLKMTAIHSALAYVFFLYGIQTLGPVLPSALLNLIPVVTILAGSILLSEKLSLVQIIGAALIIGSLFVLSLIKSKAKAKAEAKAKSDSLTGLKLKNEY